MILAAMLFLVGTTLAFVGGLIMKEKEKCILQALVLSPLRVGEYLGSNSRCREVVLPGDFSPEQGRRTRLVTLVSCDSNRFP